jgi:uncharacterized protein (DUF58 family)
MQPARQFSGLVGVASVLVLLAVLTERVLLLVGASMLASSLFVSQWRATHDFAQTQRRLSVSTSAMSGQVVPDGSTEVTIAATSTEPISHPVTIEIEYGPGVDGPDESISLSPGETRAETIHEVTFPVAGGFTLPTVSAVFESADNMVTETIPIETGVDILVEPPAPTNLHVGAGGQRVASTYGEHASGATGSGVEFMELREYLPGDGVGKIDWKATARLDEPHVRESEAETTRSIHMIFDARKAMSTGRDGRSKLAYQREVALGLVEAAAAAKDPVSLTVIDEGGIRAERKATEAAHRYDRLKQMLQTLAPNQSGERSPTPRATTSPTAARDMAARLVRTDDSEFTDFLAPYFDDTASYVERLAADPLFEVLRRRLAERRGPTWTILFTDDSDPNRIVEAARLAASNGSHATLFLTPTVLFKTNHAEDVNHAHDGYIDFEEFRRRLIGIPRVAAYEVAPGDRLAKVLNASRGATKERSNA